MGNTWTNATLTNLPGASSKPALWPVGTEGLPECPVVLAYNIRTRLELSLATSTDGGMTWSHYATLETGQSGVASCYPTVIAFQGELLTVRNWKLD